MTGTQETEQTLLPLLHFARLLLDAGPTLPVVPALVGYVSAEYEPWANTLPRPCEPHKIGITFSDSALQIAAKILDSIEADPNTRPLRGDATTDSATRRGCRPMWYPITLFYGALVVWSRMREDGARQWPQPRSSHILLSPRRLLQGFQSELEGLNDDWSCARKMALVIGNLLQ